MAMKKRFGMRAAYKIEKAIGGKTRVDPKSGCTENQEHWTEETKANFKIPLSDSRKSPISDRDRILAPKISVTIFANSEG